MSFGWRPLEGQGRSFISCSWGPMYLRVERRGQQASVKYREEEATSILPFLALASPESPLHPLPPPSRFYFLARMDPTDTRPTQSRWQDRCHLVKAEAPVSSWSSGNPLREVGAGDVALLDTHSSSEPAGGNALAPPSADRASMQNSPRSLGLKHTTQAPAQVCFPGQDWTTRVAGCKSLEWTR